MFQNIGRKEKMIARMRRLTAGLKYGKALKLNIKVLNINKSKNNAFFPHTNVVVY